MKKFIIVGFTLISLMAFADGMPGVNRESLATNENRAGYVRRSGKFQTLSVEQQEKFFDGKIQLIESRNKNRVQIETKKIEVKKLMLKDNVDWKKVEKMNRDIALLQADRKTEMFKIHKEISKVTDEEFTPNMNGSRKQKSSGRKYANHYNCR